MLVPSRRDAAGRMAAEQEKENQKARKEAARDAASWVRETATKRQLKRLRKAVELSDGNGCGDGDYFIGVANNGHNEGSRSALAVAILGPDNGEGSVGFWVAMFGDDYEERLEDQEYLATFIDAALEEFAAIESVKPATA